MSERKREWAAAAAAGLVSAGLYLWSFPLGLIFCGVLMALIAVRKKITPEELAAAWREYRLAEEGRHGLTDERRRTEQIAYLVLQKLKGKRA